jgi:hypothetical protein
VRAAGGAGFLVIGGLNVFSIHESYGQGSGGHPSHVPQVPIEFTEQFPQIAEALRGKFDPEKGHCQIPPLSFMVFCEGDRLKFCLSSKRSNKCLFGCIPDPSKPLESAEAEIMAGRCEWKVKK